MTGYKISNLSLIIFCMCCLVNNRILAKEITNKSVEYHTDRLNNKTITMIVKSAINSNIYTY